MWNDKNQMWNDKTKCGIIKTECGMIKTKCGMIAESKKEDILDILVTTQHNTTQQKSSERLHSMTIIGNYVHIHVMLQYISFHVIILARVRVEKNKLS